MERVKLIGITGGIGSGKSVVSRILRLSEEIVYDCDTEARRIMETDLSVIAQLQALLGEETYSEDGKLNRAHVASKIFTDTSLRDGVNAIVHAAVRTDLQNLVSRFSECDCFRIPGPDSSKAPRRIFCESAILATSGISETCDEIWLVTAPESQRIKRVKRRNGLSEDEIAKRFASQMLEFDNLPFNKVIEIPNADNSLLLPLIHKLLSRELHLVSKIEFSRNVKTT